MRFDSMISRDHAPPDVYGIIANGINVRKYCFITLFGSTSIKITLLPALDHDDVIAELGLDGRVGVHGVAQRRHRQVERSVLKQTKKRVNLRCLDHTGILWAEQHQTHLNLFREAFAIKLYLSFTYPLRTN